MESARMVSKFIRVLTKQKEHTSASGANKDEDEVLCHTCDGIIRRAKDAIAEWQNRGSSRVQLKLAGEVFAQSNLLTLRTIALRAEPVDERRQRAEETLATLLPLTEKLERELALCAG